MRNRIITVFLIFSVILSYLSITCFADLGETSAKFPATAITIDELANICQAMESAIRDVSLEYEWRIIPPWTFEEAAEVAKAMGAEGMPMIVQKDGLQRFKLSASGLLFTKDPNDPNSPLPERLLMEESATIMNKDGNTWNSIIIKSYNGKIKKHFQDDGWPQRALEGSVSTRKHFDIPMVLTPFGFSVFRFRLCPTNDYKPISVVLKDLGRLDNTVRKVNEFNTIRVDLLQEHTKQVCVRIYFSVDHGYTPVRYEYMRGENPQLTFEISSLEQVGDGLWFPSSGVINCTDKKRVDAWKATSKILVNRGLTEKDFDVKFPPGTKVQDEIKGTEYTVNSE
jgi:hypothetical protein